MNLRLQYFQHLERLWRRHQNSLRQLTHLAIVSGQLVRPDACSACGEDFPHAHHPAYADPLEVIWLCDRCHKELHSLMPLKPVTSKLLRAGVPFQDFEDWKNRGETRTKGCDGTAIDSP